MAGRCWRKDGQIEYQRNEANESTATCRKELFQMQTNLAAAVENLKARMARVVDMKRERYAVITKNEDLH